MRPRKERLFEISRLLNQAYPDAACELDYQTPFQLLVATILSAQCTDVRVNLVTPALFERFPHPIDFATAPRPELEKLIHSTGFYRNKAQAIQGAARMIIDEFGGELPRSVEEMIRLPGVGRKTAKVVLGEAFEIPAGIAVDTHVRRLSGRLDLSDEREPDRISADLERLLPQERWLDFSLRLVLHGRRVCTARAPGCDACVLAQLCPAANEPW